MNAELWWALGAAGFMIALIAAMTIASFLRTARIERMIARERRDWEMRSAQRRRAALRGRMQPENAAGTPTTAAVVALPHDGALPHPEIDEPAQPPLALDPMAGLAPLHPDAASPAETAAALAGPETSESADEQRSTPDNSHR